MGRIKRIDESGHFHHFELDGLALEDAEKLQVTWPDGASERVTLRLRYGAFPDVHAARLLVPYHGVVAEVALYDIAVDAERLSNKCNCSDGTCPVCQAAWERASASSRAQAARKKARAAEEARKAAEATAGARKKARR